MVLSCCAFNCKERFVKGGSVTFHAFPKDERRRKLWIEKTKRVNFVPKSATRICSKHFTEDSFDREKFGGSWLKLDAVPSVFDFQERGFTTKSHKVITFTSVPQVVEDSDGTTVTSLEKHIVLEDINDTTPKRDQYEVDASMQELVNTHNTTTASRKNILRKKMKCMKMKRYPNVNVLSQKKNVNEVNKSKETVKVTKDLNLIDSIASEMKLGTFSAGEMDFSDDKFVYLPSKRCRKKKTFFGDFASEDLKKGRDINLIQGAESAEESNENDKKSNKNEIIDSKSLVSLEDCVRSAGICDSLSEVYSVDQESSVISSERDKNISSVEKYEDVLPADENKNIKIKSIAKTRILSTTNTSKSTTCSRPDKPILKENYGGSNEINVKNQKRKCLEEDLNSQCSSLQEKAGDNIKLIENESVDMQSLMSNADSQINNFNVEGENVVVTLMSAEAITCNPSKQKDPALNLSEINENNTTEIANEISNSNAVPQTGSTIPVASTSSQKIPSILKLNLEEEEDILQRCMLLGETAKKKGLVRLKKVVGGIGGVSLDNYQNQKSLDASHGEDEASGLRKIKRKSYIGDFKVEDLESPEKAAKCFKVAEKVIKEKTVKIKMLRRRERHLMQKVEELESVIFHLVEKKMNPEEASTVLIVLKEND